MDWYNGKDGKREGLMSGVGTDIVNSSPPQGPLNGKQIPDLTKLIDDNNAYLNVHTKQDPDREIRGQIFE